MRWKPSDPDAWKKDIDQADLSVGSVPKKIAGWDAGVWCAFKPPQQINAFRAIQQSTFKAKVLRDLGIECVTFSRGFCCGHIDECPWFLRHWIDGDYQDLYIFFGFALEYMESDQLFAFPVLPNAGGEGAIITENLQLLCKAQ